MNTRPSHPWLAAGVAIAAALAQAALAQTATSNWPVKPVNVVIPFVAGGSTDNEVRLYTDRLQANLGQPFVFDFRGGAASSIGTGFVLKAPPDGYTFLTANTGLTVLPNFYPAFNHSVVSQLTPITELSNRGTGVVASVAGLPASVNNLKELVAYARANPGKMSCNTAGSGGITHIVCASMANALGIEILPVHYKGVAQGQIDLIAGRTLVSGGTLLAAMSQIKSGKLKVLAILGPKRSPLLPDVPTAHEQGYDIEYPSWLGWFAPPKMAPALVTRVNAELVKALHSPEVVSGLEKLGAFPVANTPEEFRKKFAGELAKWKKVVEDNKIQSTEN